MPVKPENLSAYPGGSIRSPEWLALREVVRARAGDRCEWCGVANRAVGFRIPDGEFMELGPHYRPGDRIELVVDEWCGVGVDSWPIIKIVCTVAHIDQELVDHSPDNLAFLCQRCHNSHDAPGRAIRAAATRKARKPVTLLDLMEGRA